MRHIYSYILLFFIVTPYFVIGQNNPSSHLNTEGIVVFMNSESTNDLPAIDWDGNFVFSSHDTSDQHPRSLWRYNFNSKKWTRVKGKANFPSKIYGRADLTAINKNSHVTTIYWKDKDQSLWCLSALGNHLENPTSLKKAWEGDYKHIKTKNKYGFTIWRIKTPILIQY